ncbi:MAG TPA: DHH family phosphoesterase [Candidatus Saccharimonadales bacterium]|nr:DHH family phosphoesterase [Candidatus Saccharimonadales bacterium]
MKDIQTYIDNAEKIVIVQADNPDADSLSSAIALEQLLFKQGKDPALYCGVDMPGYLKYIKGWDRVSKDLPKKFDLTIIVDNSSLVLLETLEKTNQLGWIKAKPVIVIDHHSTETTLDFIKASFIEKAVSTTELIYKLAKNNNWEINKEIGELITIGILSDSLGLTTDQVSQQSVQIIAEMLGVGVRLNEIDAKRKELSKKTPELVEYKSKLLGRIKYSLEGRVAYISIPWEEIEKYSQEYNPPMLVIDEMRQIIDVQLAVAFKSYPNGRITAKLRSNPGFPICAKLAEHFGGGGHQYASGFRVTDGRKLSELKTEVFDIASKLLEQLK